MNRLRRDPRAERAASVVMGGARPRFSLGASRATGRPRRDPRADTAAQQVPSTRLLRLDRGHRAAPNTFTAVQQREAEEPVSNVIVVEAPAFLVAVVPDLSGGRLTSLDRQLFGAARALAGSKGAVIALVPSGCEDFAIAGADRVALLPNERESKVYDPDVAAMTIAAAFSILAPRHMLFGESATGGDLARRVALLTGESLFPDVEVITATSIARAARGRRIEQRCAPTRLISVAPDAIAPYASASREARPQPLSLDLYDAGATVILDARDILADPASVPLALADFVTSAGNGITDFDMFRRVVAALGATPGASRVLCDAGLMPRAAQVGASGTVLAATCYFALGIAGAPQHLQGVAGCEHVVAVNTDLHAAMVERAGLAIVQDAQRVMPALLAALAYEGGDPA